MVFSMTGYGRGEVQVKNETVFVEVKSLNNRFLDIALRIQKKFSVFEDKIKELIQREVVRGRIDVFITTSEDQEKSFIIKPNLELAKGYLAVLKDLQKELSLPGEVTINDLLKYEDILTFEYCSEDVDYFWPKINEALKNALEELNRMRRSEGQNLEKDLRTRAHSMDSRLREIEKISENKAEEEYKKLKQKIGELLDDDTGVDEHRLEMEIALISEKVDITEECTRLKSHISLFLESLDKETAIGRRLEFILQEMNREVSTIAAKCNSSEITHKVVELKEEIEKLREQSRNIL